MASGLNHDFDSSGLVDLRVAVIPEDAVRQEELLRPVAVALDALVHEQPAEGCGQDEDDHEAEEDAGAGGRRRGRGSALAVVADDQRRKLTRRGVRHVRHGDGSVRTRGGGCRCRRL